MTAPRILIVEDNAIVAHNLQDDILEIGYEVCGILFSGEEAVAQLPVLKPDLVLMDIKLEGEMDGVEAAGRIRAEWKIPVIYLTGHSDDTTLHRAKYTQPYGYLLKPFNQRELLSAIEVALYKHSMEQRLRESERRYRMLSELTSDYAYAATVEADGRLLLEWASEALLRLTGLVPGQAYIAAEWQGLIAPEDAPLVVERLASLLSGQAQTVEHRLVSSEGEQRWVRHYARPVDAPHVAGSIRVCGAAQDITAERLARDALQGAHDELEARVNERTAELAAANLELQAKIVERRQAEEALQRRNRDLALLNRVIAAANSGEDVESVFEVVCRDLVATLRAAQATVALVEDWEGGRVRVVAEHHTRATRAPEWGAVLPSCPGGEARCHGASEPLIVADTGPAAVPAAMASLMHSSGTRALAILPLSVEQREAGSLGLGYGTGHAFDQEEISLLEAIAEELAAALERARLTENQRRLSAAVEQSGGGVLITDTRGIIQYVNSAFERTTHFSRAEVLGRTPRILKSGEHDEAFYQRLWQTIEAGQVWQGRFIDLRKDGTPFYQETAITPVRDGKGQITNYVATMRDVTREVQLEQQFRQAQKLEALGRLAGSIAHDFRNLLTIIQISATFLEQSSTGEADITEARRILRTTQRGTDLVQQLLRFGRREVAQVQEVDLNDVVREMGPMFRRLLQKKIELVTRLEPGMWAITGNASQIEQVLMNLVVNARDAMPGGGQLAIETKNVMVKDENGPSYGEVRSGPYALLTVCDTGSGMDEQVQAHLFEPFFTTKPSGTGLGLAAVYGIVTQSGGHIRVHSRPGQGSTFQIFLPAIHHPNPARVESRQEIPLSEAPPV